MNEPSRVFISCGQSAAELDVAGLIKQVLTDLGFEPYVAAQVQSVRALRENIFQQLRDTEYFLFVDFRREQLVQPDDVIYRGSLFSHQELAIASFIELQILAFQEEGVKKLDGILGQLQLKGKN